MVVLPLPTPSWITVYPPWLYYSVSGQKYGLDKNTMVGVRINPSIILRKLTSL